MVKNLVRLALASEYSRRPIKREDIRQKVLGSGPGRQQFRYVFEQANEQLRNVFGMTLTELPTRERVTVTQKRAAQRSAGNKAAANGGDTQSQAIAAMSASSSSASKQYIVTSTLPVRYRLPAILPPARIPTSSAEAGYVGFTTFILGLIYLSPGGTLSESRLEKQLRRMNADNYVLGEKTEKGALARMLREGYIIKIRERDGGGEETVDFMIGPRGKVEIAETGVAGLVRKVYGRNNVDVDELERRLVRSLGESVTKKAERGHSVDRDEEPDQHNGHGEAAATGRATRGATAGTEEQPAEPRRRSRRLHVEEEAEDEEDEEAEEEEEDGEGDEEVEGDEE